MSATDPSALERRLAELEAENQRLRALAESKTKVAARALAAYQQRVERLSVALSRLEERDRRISEDLEEARRFQALMLARPAILAELGAAAIYRPAEVVGGDLYDVTPLPDGGLRVFIADATGHGVQAALRTMVVKTEYDRLRNEAATPAALLEQLSERLVAHYPGLELRATAACLDLSRAGQLRYASCAHPPLLLVDPTGAVEEVYEAAPFLAATASIHLPLVERTLAPGTRLCLYTDGLTEQPVSGGAFGIGPLVDALRASALGPAFVELERAFAGACATAEGGTQVDDATVFAITSSHDSPHL